MKTYCQLHKTATATSCSTDYIPLPKDRHYFKPEQFVWNNPHRTSPRLYPYYHAAQDHYLVNGAPRIQRLQEIDKENQQKRRIDQILSNRAKSRLLLKQRQLSREALEQKAQTRNRNWYRSSKTLQSIKFIGSSNSVDVFDLEIYKSVSSIKTFKKLNYLESEVPKSSVGSSFATPLGHLNQNSLPNLQKVGWLVKKEANALLNSKSKGGNLRSK